MTSRAVSIAAALRDELADILGPTVNVVRVWVPSFDKSQLLEKPIVAVRPASRTFGREGKFTGPLDTVIEIGILRRTPPPASSTIDPNNDLTAQDPIDALAEQVFDLFVPYDRDDLDPEDISGMLAEIAIDDHLPRDVSQPSTVDVQHLNADRDWITVILVTYRKQL